MYYLPNPNALFEMIKNTAIPIKIIKIYLLLSFNALYKYNNQYQCGHIQ